LGKEDKFRYKGAAMLASMGIAMVLSTFLGLVIGLYLDRIAAGFWNIHVTIKRYGS
jgi:hypothetical protein